MTPVSIHLVVPFALGYNLSVARRLPVTTPSGICSSDSKPRRPTKLMDNPNYWSETQDRKSSGQTSPDPELVDPPRSAATGSSAGSGQGGFGRVYLAQDDDLDRSGRDQGAEPRAGRRARRRRGSTWPRPAPWPSSTTRTSCRSTTWAGPTTASATWSRSSSRAATWPSG